MGDEHCSTARFCLRHARTATATLVYTFAEATRDKCVLVARKSSPTGI